MKMVTGVIGFPPTLHTVFCILVLFDILVVWKYIFVGHYCEVPGLSYPSGLCEAGYFCYLGSNSSNPSDTTASGGPCPAGTYCIEGSSEPVDCSPGYYNPIEVQSECLDCPAGAYCEAASVNFTDCPKGLYQTFPISD